MKWQHLPPLSSLRAFAAYAQTGNIVSAAGALGISHPAISQQIRSLESHLGLTLVDRSGRALELTAEGEVLASAVLEGFSAMIRSVEVLTGIEDARPLHVSTTPSFASTWLMPRLATFRQANPDIEIVISATADLVELQPGGVDVAIRYGVGPWPGFETSLLFSSPLVVVAAPELLVGLPDRTPETLAGLPWLEEVGGSEGSTWLAAHGAGNVRRGSSVQAPGNLMLDGVRNGQGIAISVRQAVEPDIAAGRLVLLDQSSDESSGYHCVVRPGVHRPPLKAFMKWLRKMAKT